MMDRTKVLAIVQARISSSRFPGKVMKPVEGKPLIEHVLLRLSKSRLIDKVVLAMPTDPENNKMGRYISQLGFDVFRGSESDVLDRYYKAAKRYNADVVVRVTGDCPLIDYEVTDKVIQFFLNNDFDYVSNINPPTFPVGLDTEVFAFESLEKAWKEAGQQYEREHVTPYMRKSDIFKVGNVENVSDWSSERWDVDKAEDFDFVSSIFHHFTGQRYFGMEDILNLKEKMPELFDANQDLRRNE